MLRTRKSKSLFSKSKEVLVGGVNSPVRAFQAVGGSPLFIVKAGGAFVHDADGNRLTDFVGSWGPMILGHSHPKVVRAIKKQAAVGTSYGAPTELEIEMGNLVKIAFPAMERIRFVSSGTEAAMTALRLARACTQRDKIIKFSGCYHGHSDGLLVKAGSGAATLGIPDSAGVSISISQETLVLPYNGTAALESTFREIGETIAAVIVEPVAANMGLVLPESGFLKAARDLTSKYGAVLIFDEVITGFRLAFGGAQTLFGIVPDLTCLGKIIGGGLPVGAVGGKREVMELLAPAGPVYQAGTLSGNPLAMAAGLATLSELKRMNPYKTLERRAKTLADALKARLSKLAIPAQVSQIGSLFTVFFSPTPGASAPPSPVRDFETAKKCDSQKYAGFFHALLDEKIYFPPSQFETCFVSLAHTDTVMARSEKAISRALERSFS